jgi:hypothetical protein
MNKYSAYSSDPSQNYALCLPSPGNPFLSVFYKKNFVCDNVINLKVFSLKTTDGITLKKINTEKFAKRASFNMAIY